MTSALSRIGTDAPRLAADEAFVDLENPDFEAFWYARVWKFPHTNPATPVIAVNWEFKLPSGGVSSASEHFVLFESFKTALWGALTNDSYGKRLSVGTLPAISGGIREAFRWLAWQGIQDFSEISEAVLDEYLKVLPRLILAKDEVYPGFVAEGFFGLFPPAQRPGDEADHEEVISDSTQEDDGVSYSQVANRLNTFYYIHAQRRLLAKRGLPVLPQPPFKGRPAGEVTSELAEWVINRIPALPQDVSLPMLTEVLRWVDEVGPLVKSAHLHYHSALRRGPKALRAAYAELDAAGFSRERLELLSWRERTDAARGLSSPHRMRLATLMYRDACVLALQYLAGLRISEVCSPVVRKNKVDGLASCIYKGVSPDGMMDLYFLKGILVKGRRSPKANEWVIGCAPYGSDQLPVLVRALNQLHDLITPFLSDDHEQPLFLHYANGWGMPRSEESLVQADGTALHRGSRRFMRCYVDLTRLPDYDQSGNSLVLYRESRGQCIRTHQGRKTFADYCLKTRKTVLSALSFHYKHLTEAITYKGYYSAIQRLDNDLEDMAHSATVDFFVSRSEGRTVFGAMADAVDRFFEEHGLDSTADVRLLRPKVEDIVIAHDIRIYFNDYGNCLMSVRPLDSRCQQAAGGVSWMLRRPNYKTRNASMCAGCNCFLLDKSHLPHWERRAATWKEAAKDPSNRVAVKSYQQSVKVVRWFKEVR